MKKSIVSVLLLCLASCDCYQKVAGNVTDKESGRPLAGVSVYNKEKDRNKTTTDSTGHFELSEIAGGFRCPPLTLVFENPGYLQTEKTIPSGEEVNIGMEKVKAPVKEIKRTPLPTR